MRTNTLVGTPEYFAPETILGKAPRSARKSNTIVTAITTVTMVTIIIIIIIIIFMIVTRITSFISITHITSIAIIQHLFTLRARDDPEQGARPASVSGSSLWSQTTTNTNNQC